MLQTELTRSWNVIGVVSWGNLLIYVNFIFIYHRIDCFASKVLDALKRGDLESIRESSPIMIGFNPKWPLTNVRNSKKYNYYTNYYRHTIVLSIPYLQITNPK